MSDRVTYRAIVNGIELKIYMKATKLGHLEAVCDSAEHTGDLQPESIWSCRVQYKGTN